MSKRAELLTKSLPGGTKAHVVQAGPLKRVVAFALLQLEYPEKGNKKGYARAVSGRYLSVSAVIHNRVSS